MTSNDPPSYPGPQDQPHPYQPQPYQQYDPYSGQPYPQPQEYGGAYPPPMPPTAVPYGYGAPPADNTKGWVIGALVTNIVLTLGCCSPLGIAGIVTSAIAMGRVDTQPESARSLLKWSWGLAIASVVLVIVLVALFIGLGLANDPNFN